MSVWEVAYATAVLAIAMLEVANIAQAISLSLTWDRCAAVRETWSRWTGRSSGHELCAIERFVHQEMSEVCVQRMRSLCAIFRLLLVGLLCLRTVARLHTTGSDAPGFIATGIFWAVCLWVHCRPGLLHGGNSDSFYVAFMIGQGFVTCTIADVAILGQFSCIQSLFTLLMSACCFRLWVAVCSMLGLMATRLVAVRLIPAGSTAASNFLMWELAGTALLLGCVIIFRVREFAFLRSYFGEKSVRQSNTAMTRLLGLICDATVELNAELQIVQPAAKFAAILGLDTHLSIEGKLFGDFTPDEDDQSRFASLALSSLSDLSGAMPGAMYATLCGPDVRLPVELLCVQFQSLEGTSRLFVGVREAPEQPKPQDRPLDAPKRQIETHQSLRRSRGGCPRHQRSGFPSPPRRRTDSVSLLLPADGCGEDRPHGAFAPAIACGVAPPQAALTPRRRGTPSGPPAMVVGARTPLQVAAPALVETSESARNMSLIHTLLSWNVRVPRTSCCLYHAYVERARARLTELAGQRCQADFKPITEVQCQECGLLGEGWGDEEGQDARDLECAFCAGPMARTAPAPTAAAHVVPL